jgi:hypothetical protein
MPARPGARTIAAVLGAVLVLAVGVVPAAAAPALGVRIESHVTFNPDGPNYGWFTASGPAVGAGIVCASGTFVDTGIKFAGYQARTGIVQLQVAKTFSCDGGGTFDVKMQIQADFNTGLETFAWVITGASGGVAGLQGAGTGSTVPTSTGNINTYLGMVS